MTSTGGSGDDAHPDGIREFTLIRARDLCPAEAQRTLAENLVTALAGRAADTR